VKRISIAVHGRFHAFELAAALLEAGHDVHLLTNYPRRVVARWFAPDRTTSMVLHGVLTRAANRVCGGEQPALVEGGLKKLFGGWAARKHLRRHPDVVHCWSGVAEETLLAGAGEVCTVARGSSHIGAQHALLTEEQARVGMRLEKPSRWIMQREQREYTLADRIIVPSEFARRTFLEHGVSEEKVRVVNLSVRATGFEAPRKNIEARLERLKSRRPLRVLYAGMLSYRKGMHDLHAVLQTCGREMDFRLVGAVLPECRAFARDAAKLAKVEPAVPQQELPDVYAWGDVFLLPTIEDGFAVVLAQAQAAGLPIICTTNCGGPDIIANGGQGWVVPIRSPESIIERLRWCNDNRDEVARMVEQLHLKLAQRDWATVAHDFMQAVT
jgi:glycosyltransferase involved in cell wall biosynthesis